MSKFIIACLLIGAVFYSGIYFGQNLSDHPGKTGKEETMFSEYEKWKDQQKLKEEQQATKNKATISDEKKDIYSTAASGVSDILKNTSRMVVFNFLAAFEKVIHALLP